MKNEIKRDVPIEPSYFCAYPKGSKQPDQTKINTYYLSIGCPHLVDLNHRDEESRKNDTK
ncbi:hypothetical protein IPM62_03955 [Candidatus Woesebacteria bacterium]|nr:MAG: hypothetical protein IPM62_03955 [Candidatus Woesebacteria bacterium]